MIGWNRLRERSETWLSVGGVGRAGRRVLAIILIASLGTLVLPLTRIQADSGTSGQAPQAGSFVGSWLVTLPDEPTANGAPRMALLTATSDGIVLSSDTPTSPVMPGQGPPGVSRTYATSGFGAWGQSGDQEEFTFYEIDFDDAGNVIDIVKITASGSVSTDGNGWSGQYRVEIDDPSGNVIFASPGAVGRAQATRITPQPF